MAAATNDITGAVLRTKPASQSFKDNWDLIFGGKPTKEHLDPELDELLLKQQSTDLENVSNA